MRTFAEPGRKRAKLIVYSDSKTLSVEGTSSTKLLARVTGESTGVVPAFRYAGAGDEDEFSFGVPADWETTPTSDGAGAGRTTLVLSQAVEWDRLYLIARRAGSIDVDLTANRIGDIEIVATGQVVVRLSERSVSSQKYDTVIDYDAPEYSKLTLVLPRSVTLVFEGRDTPVAGAVETEKGVWILRGTGRKRVLVQTGTPIGAVGEPTIVVERAN